MLWLAILAVTLAAASADTNCLKKGGSCIDVSCCPWKNYISGLCNGGNNRKCCMSKSSCSTSSGSCPVARYQHSRLIGDAVYVHKDFNSAMRSITSAADQCNVKVYVTHSWRRVGARIGNTVVSPASNSNHLVGMAIDMNLDTSSGFCNGDCIMRRSNSGARCFVSKVQDFGLTWGGVFNDPVHIDNRRNTKSGYSNLRTQLQAACKHIPMS